MPPSYINKQGHFGYTALHRAILSDTGWLIVSFGDPSHTALRQAQSNKEGFIMELLRTPGIQVNIQSEVGETALHLAVSRLSIAVVQQLLDRHICNFSVLCYNYSYSVFHHAVLRPDGIEMLELLLCARAKLIESGTPGSTELINLGHSTPLHIAVYNRNAAAVNMLLQHGASAGTALDPAAHGSRAIETQELYDCLQLLVSRSHKYLTRRNEYDDETPLEIARSLVASWNREPMTPENVWRIKVKSHLIGLIEHHIGLRLLEKEVSGPTQEQRELEIQLASPAAFLDTPRNNTSIIMSLNVCILVFFGFIGLN
ncbi:hypothetical protein Q9L58_010483 [Maublancomyces gigas]|uniref:Uncharacterized protein n=1 Tax=Discina gigas TaxID=1032678 RepID=A0ABR3G3Y0_9PEZI